MKKILHFAAFLFCFAAAKAQTTYTSGHLTVTMSDTMFHDSTRCMTSLQTFFEVTVNPSYMGETVNVIDTMYGTLMGTFVNTTGASPWTFTTGAGGVSTGSGSYYGIPDYNTLTGGMVHMLAYGRKIVASPDTVITATYADSLLVTDLCEYGMVDGRTYADNNGNCSYDAGDTGLILEHIYANLTLTAPTAGMTHWEWPNYVSMSGGLYTMKLQKSWMTNYTVSLPAYYAFIFPGSCPAGPYTYTTLPQSGLDFPLQCTSNVDLECDGLLPAKIRWHTPFFINTFVNNTGCSRVSGTVTLVKDSRTIYDPSLTSIPADTVHGDTLIWNYANLSSLAGGAYWNSFISNVYLTQDATVAPGDTLCFRIYTQVPTTDVNPLNNDVTVCVPVVYSFDPNVKEVTPAGVGATGDIPLATNSLKYKLHFQNTGSDAAWDITIIDTLDVNLDPSTLKVMGASHNMEPKWLAPGVVAFVFDNIMLPDSLTNEPASHGQVEFSISLDAGLPVGTQIRNTGYIYFDANPPVITNTVVNTLTVPTGLEEVTNVAVKIYPNPATDVITIENLKGGVVSVMNVSGAEIMKQGISKDKETVDISRLPPGMYLLKTVDSHGTTTTKLVKY